jgi:hypothetical protein
MDAVGTRHRGAALLFALGVLMIVSTLGTVLTFSVLRTTSMARDTARRDEMLNAAESGIEIAIRLLARDGELPRQEAELPGGMCAIEAARLVEGEYRIVSVSRCEGHACTVTVDAGPASDPGRYRITSWNALFED